jgi:formaldehyde-activating enzyme involved in methanogenesis
MKRRKVTYPVARTHTKGAPRAGAGPEVAVVRPNLVAIDITAGAGRSNLNGGGRVRIYGNGLYAGEEAVIERLVAGVIPAATVRTDGGGTRRVRTIDLEPIGGAH